MKIVYNKSTGVVYDALQDHEPIERLGDQLLLGRPAGKVYTQSSELEVVEGVTVPEGWTSGKYCYQPETGDFVLNIAWGERYYTQLNDLQKKYDKLITSLLNNRYITQQDLANIEGLPPAPGS